jgi:hypothetical protein
MKIENQFSLYIYDDIKDNGKIIFIHVNLMEGEKDSKGHFGSELAILKGFKAYCKKYNVLIPINWSIHTIFGDQASPRSLYGLSNRYYNAQNGDIRDKKFINEIINYFTNDPTITTNGVKIID